MVPTSWKAFLRNRCCGGWAVEFAEASGTLSETHWPCTKSHSRPSYFYRLPFVFLLRMLHCVSRTKREARSERYCPLTMTERLTWGGTPWDQQVSFQLFTLWGPIKISAPSNPMRRRRLSGRRRVREVCLQPCNLSANLGLATFLSFLSAK